MRSIHRQLSNLRNSSNSSPSSPSRTDTLTLAQKYDQDRQRLIDCCFSKFDRDNNLHENYITHVRIIEDSYYPSAKPPPSSAQSHKKNRILALAVKRSGKVRLHKGRENNDSTFQIGRTWDLDDLASIDIDTSSQTGFNMFLGKSYYWETNSAKERTVFLKSICNIYSKYKNGELPKLTGFDADFSREINALARSESLSSKHSPTKSRSNSYATPNDQHNTKPVHQSNSISSQIFHHFPKSNSPHFNQKPASPTKSIHSIYSQQSQSQSQFAYQNHPSNTQLHQTNQLQYQNQNQNLPARMHTIGNNNNKNIQNNPQHNFENQPLPNHINQPISTFPNNPLSPVHPAIPGSPSHPYNQLKNKNFENGSTISNVDPSISIKNDNIRKNSLSTPQTPGTRSRKGSILNNPKFKQFEKLEKIEKVPLNDPTIRSLSGKVNQNKNIFDNPSFSSSSNSLAGKTPSIAHKKSLKNIGKQFENNSSTLSFQSTSSSLKKAPEIKVKTQILPKVRNYSNNTANSPIIIQSNTTINNNPNQTLPYSNLQDSTTIRSISTNDRNQVQINIQTQTQTQTQTQIQMQMPIVPSPGTISPLKMSPGVNILTEPQNNLTQTLPKLQPNDLHTIPSFQITTETPNSALKGVSFSDSTIPPVVDPNSAIINSSNVSTDNVLERKGHNHSSSIASIQFKSRRSNHFETEQEDARKEEKRINRQEENNNNNNDEDEDDDDDDQFYDSVSDHKYTNSDSQIETNPEIKIIINNEVQEIKHDNEASVSKNEDEVFNKSEKTKPRALKFAEEKEVIPSSNVETKHKRVISASSIRTEISPLEELLDEIDWKSSDDSKTIEKKLLKALASTEYESINSLISVSLNYPQINGSIDASIIECEKLDPLLTFFQVELGAFQDEINYIEQQGHGLQVKTTNKKLLWNELKDILANINLSDDELKILHSSPMSNSNEIMMVENVLISLYGAIKTIKGVGQDKEIDEDDIDEDKRNEEDLGEMRAVQERKNNYERTTNIFLSRFSDLLFDQFKFIFNELDGYFNKLLMQYTDLSMMNENLDFKIIIDALLKQFSKLFVFDSIILFAKKISSNDYYNFIKSYQTVFAKLFHNLIGSYKLNLSKLIKAELSENTLKTSFDLYNGNLTVHGTGNSNDLKLSEKSKTGLKRNQTLAKFRGADKNKKLKDQFKQIDASNKDSTGLNQQFKIMSIFSSGLEKSIYEKLKMFIVGFTNLIIHQQDFVVEFFHLSSYKYLEFEEYIKKYDSPEKRIQSYLSKKSYIDNRMELNNENASTIVNLIGWLFNNDINVVINYIVEVLNVNINLIPAIILLFEVQINSLNLGNQEFVLKNFINKGLNKIKLSWSTYISDEIRLIEKNVLMHLDTSKRIGILYSVKLYPKFVDKIESIIQLGGMDHNEINGFEIRRTMDKSYTDLGASFVKSLEKCYNDCQTIIVSTTTNASVGNLIDDSINGISSRMKSTLHSAEEHEEKTKINKAINLMKNTNYLVEKFSVSDNSLIMNFRTNCFKIYKDSLNIYISLVLQRPIGRLIDFIEGIENITSKNNISGKIIDPTKISGYNRSSLKKLLSFYDYREIHKGIETLYKRVEKHLLDFEEKERDLSNFNIDEKDVNKIEFQLLGKVWKSIENEFITLSARFENILMNYYKDIEIQFLQTEMVQAFASINKQH
ncbi:GTP-Rho binding exocyst subunit SEC3 ASCRUDRAFT_6626 [Ascoidea rubescens DSM 1968]|uniref:Exocyst complex component Sec3 PIP2-binding N-terminal domain-containing protein n=1 Tax=Ascoidea rubescens DSM 1968 TaxID=1344418 RepID=A0A1D2VN45_9ASCO|nr:hypothetical protein ASCRUDRAFT_6626 [Ascoidea rubescens DSM 1968]ODV63026.1 hypothetical protein ASCRUDRAFT_6626 [Ascoidea rubescens DSM 1968]